MEENNLSVEKKRSLKHTNGETYLKVPLLQTGSKFGQNALNQTPTFVRNEPKCPSIVSPVNQDRELDCFSATFKKFNSTLESLLLPDRIQLVKKSKIDENGQIRDEFDLHSMEQSLELENLFFNTEEFSINFEGKDLLEFSFKKAEGIKMERQYSSTCLSIDHQSLMKFSYKQFAIAFSVEGEIRRIGYIKKISGVFYIMDTKEELMYKIQKVDTFKSGFQKVFILDKKDSVLGSLELVQLTQTTLACTVIFPHGMSNCDKFLIMGTVFILMWKIPTHVWIKQFSPSNNSFIVRFLRKIFGKLCPKRNR